MKTTYTYKDVAAITGCGIATVRRLANELFPHSNTGKKRYLAQEQATELIGKLPKRNMVSIGAPISNDIAPVSNDTGRIDRLESMVEKMLTAMMAMTKQMADTRAPLQIEQDYYSILAYSNITRRRLMQTEANTLGRLAASLCRERGLEIRKVPDERWGEVCSFPAAILAEVFQP